MEQTLGQTNTLPVIDWEQALRVAGNQQALAKDLLAHLIRNLSDEVKAIKQAYTEQNYTEMRRLLHKLHGALCYCGLPRLKRIVARLETHLENNIMESLPQGIEVLDTEARLLLEHHSCQT